MGTSTMGSDLHSDKQDKLLKLQARKKELESRLATKNEELYKLCVQEVQLTGVMPPEVPLSPEVPTRERLGSIRSVERGSEGDDVRDGSDTTSRRLRAGTGDRLHDSEQNLRKNLTHRLSTPSISGISMKSSHSRHTRRPETSCSNFFPSPPQDRSETFSMHTSHTYPALAGRHDTQNENMHSEPPMYNKHHTMATEYMNKIYYTNTPEAHNVSRLRETHFSSSHPDITTNYNQGSNASHAAQHQNVQTSLRNGPLLYQYASQLKAQSQHLGSLSHHHQNQMPVHPKRRQEGARRNTLQRTQTYHLTSHSEYNQHLENLADNYRSQPIYPHRSQTDIQEHPSDRVHIPERVIQVPNTLPLRERNTLRHPMHMQLQVSTDDYNQDNTSRPGYPETMSPVSQMSGFSQGNFDSVSMKFSPLSQADLRVKEKQWYETSLDTPSRAEIPAAPLLKKSSSLKRTSSIGNSQAYEVMMSTGRNAPMQSPSIPSSPAVLSPNTLSPNTLSPNALSPNALSPNAMSPSAVSLDSPKNLTVVEQGKCIPYREETKPFEMSDFYKYSTKFRQGNVPKPANPTPNPSGTGYNKLPMELPNYAQDGMAWPSQSH